MSKRVEGYREVMQRAELEPAVRMFLPQPEAISAQVDLWLKQRKPPTAIFSLNCMTSIFLLKDLAERGVRIPEEIALVGFDDLQLAELLAPPLTVVRQPAAKIGADAARLLLERMAASSAAPADAPARRVTLETELVLRRSCGCNPS